jgi:hypothetical protein
MGHEIPERVWDEWVQELIFRLVRALAADPLNPLPFSKCRENLQKPTFNRFPFPSLP